MSLSALLIRISEGSQPVKLGRANKIAKFLEIVLRLSREAHDESRSQGNVWHDAPHLLNRLQKYLGARSAPHQLQNVWRRMLQRNIHVRTNLFMRSNGFQKPGRDLIRVGIQEPHPAHILNLGQTLQQHRQAVLQPEILAVAGCILSDQRELEGPSGNELFRFRNYRLKPP